LSPKLGYSVLIKTSGNRLAALHSLLQAWPKQPVPGVNLLGAWNTFGAYDFILNFVSDSPEAAQQFIQQKLRTVEGVTTETLIGQPVGEYTKQWM
jgi:uncharacterized protein with GYD domain